MVSASDLVCASKVPGGARSATLREVTSTFDDYMLRLAQLEIQSECLACKVVLLVFAPVNTMRLAACSPLLGEMAGTWQLEAEVVPMAGDSVGSR